MPDSSSGMPSSDGEGGRATPERWLVLSVSTPSRDLTGLVAEGLFALGAGGVQENADHLLAYLPVPADPERYVATAHARLAAELPPGVPLTVRWSLQPDEDWIAVWRRGLVPRRVTDRIVVKPTWTDWPSTEGQVVIEIDPQMAFGTGEHATTRGCLRLLDSTLMPGDRVLDVGSGSGILAIVAARLGAAGVLAVESDPDANLNARENFALNVVTERVSLVEAKLDRELLGEIGPFDLILANILSGVIRPLLPAFHAALRPGGRVIVSGILREESADLVTDAVDAGFEISRVDEEAEWWSALLLPRDGS